MDIEATTHVHSQPDLPLFFGMQYSIHSITSRLKDGSLHTAILTTSGMMDGIGKSSCAKYVYGLHNYVFDRSSFNEDIGRKCAQQFNGLLDLQNQLFDDVSKTGVAQVWDISIYTHKIQNVCPYLESCCDKEGFQNTSRNVDREGSLTRTHQGLGL